MNADSCGTSLVGQFVVVVVVVVVVGVVVIFYKAKICIIFKMTKH